MAFDMKDYELGKRPLWAIAASLIIFIALAFFAMNCVAMGDGSRLLPIYSVETEEKEIAVTFNCAWSAEDIPEILEVLERYDAKATFFILGQWAKDNPSAVKMIADAGHEIGTHSNTHPDMAKLSPEEIRNELYRSCKYIEEAGGGKPKFFRAPSGSYSNELVKTAMEQGFMTIQWDIDSRDWKDVEPEKMTENVTKNAGKGSIILFHAGKENTLSALPAILEILDNSGYDFVGISELVYSENYTVDHTGRQYSFEQKK
ncbi:MAG: polysaccharide deacetylase family protein [Oscillospiraceae bacterium]|nr:polysaccharide deacetylase family protein [Oscillospiraceae bacterium]